MGRGQKGSSDMEKLKMREESPEPERGGCRQTCRFPLLLALLQLLLGVAVAVVAFLKLSITSSLLARETPHWAGIILDLVYPLWRWLNNRYPWTLHPEFSAHEIEPAKNTELCLVSIVGLVLYCVTSHPDERSFLQYAVKLLYFILCSLGLVISVLVIAFAGHHYTQTTSFTCERKGPDCVCTREPQDPIARTFAYQDVEDCAYLTSDLPMYFLLQILLNLAQALVCAVAAFIMWKNRYQVFFAGLQISSWQKV